MNECENLAEVEDLNEDEEHSEAEMFADEETVVLEVQDCVAEESPSASNSGASIARATRAAIRNSKSTWSKSTGIDTQVPEFKLPDSSEVIELLTPLKYFFEFFDDEILDKIVVESNLYALQKDINKPLQMERNELKKWLGLVVYFSISKLPNTKMHWSKKLTPLTNFAAEVMSRDRFHFIKSNIHLADNTGAAPPGHPNYDPMYKVRPLINHLREKFQKIPLDQNICIDEQMVPYKGKTKLKQYIPNKPKKFGYKLFVLASEHGLMHDFIPYEGKITPVEDANVPDLGASSNIVLHLAQNIPTEQNHLLFFDNWFTSIPLLQYLAGKGIWCCGTVRVPRLSGLPKTMKDDKKLVQQGRGAHEESEFSDETSKVTLVRWYDNKVVNLVSTFAKAKPLRTLCRFDKKTRRVVDISCPDIVHRYNKSMGGVDLADQMISLYRINIKSKKAYHRLIYHFIDMALVNAWLLYRKNCNILSIPKKDVLQLSSFKLNIAVALTKTGIVQPNKRGRPSREEQTSNKRRRCNIVLDDVRLDHIDHLPSVDKNRQRCRVLGCKGQTKFFCKKCDAHLCLDKNKNCFQSFHTC